MGNMPTPNECVQCEAPATHFSPDLEPVCARCHEFEMLSISPFGTGIHNPDLFLATGHPFARHTATGKAT